MLKILDGYGRSWETPGFDEGSAVVLIGSTSDQFRVKAHDLGHGHTEVTAARVVHWKEAEWSPQYTRDVMDCILKAREEADPVEVAKKNRDRCARRARTRVRRLCKAMGADTLLTLTYRANVTDLARAKADLKEFNRRMIRVLPGFRCVACFEEQDRGAWHMHLATAGLPTFFDRVNSTGQSYRVKSFDVFRAVWRSVSKEAEGNVDVSKRKRNSKRSPAKIAAYIAKYIGKAFENGMDEGVNRWTKFGAVEVAQPVDLGIVNNLMDALGVAYGIIEGRQEIARASLDKWQDWFFLAAERGKPGRIHAQFA